MTVGHNSQYIHNYFKMRACVFNAKKTEQIAEWKVEL